MSAASVRNRNMRALGAIVGVVALITLTAAAGGGQHVSGPRVLVIGDSILNFSQTDVSNSLDAAGWQALVDGRSGSTMEEWDTLVGPDAALARPDVAVVELGTNDCDKTCSDLGSAIDSIVEQLIANGAGTVLWLNVQTMRSPAIPGAPLYPLHAEYVNYALEQAAVRWPEMQIVDFNSLFGQHPEWHIADGFHPNALGEQALAFLITAELHLWLPAGH
jgi:lysophospholipase L1-like esterase